MGSLHGLPGDGVKHDLGATLRHKRFSCNGRTVASARALCLRAALGATFDDRRMPLKLDDGPNVDEWIARCVVGKYLSLEFDGDQIYVSAHGENKHVEYFCCVRSIIGQQLSLCKKRRWSTFASAGLD